MILAEAFEKFEPHGLKDQPASASAGAAFAVQARAGASRSLVGLKMPCRPVGRQNGSPNNFTITV